MATLNIATMDTPTGPNWLQFINEYWKEATLFFAAVGAIWGYIKLVHGKWQAIKLWFKNAAAAPNAILEIRKELEFEPGLTVRQRLATIGDDINHIRQVVSNEIANRRAALQHVETPLFEFDLKGHFVWANDALLEMVAADIEQVRINNWRNIIAGPDRVQVIEGWSQAVADGTDYRTKFRLAIADGAESWVIFSVLCNKDDSGNILGWIGKMRKISDPREVTQG